MPESSTPIDPLQFRQALGRFASGVTVITVRHDGFTHGMTANAFISVSLNPPLVLVSVNHKAQMHRLLPHSSRFGVSVLSDDQENLSNLFAGRGVEKQAFTFATRDGIPLLEGALAHLIVRLVDAHAAGDHTLYIGEVEYLDWQDGNPLLFFAGKYRQIKTEVPILTPWPEDEFWWFSTEF